MNQELKTLQNGLDGRKQAVSKLVELVEEVKQKKKQAEAVAEEKTQELADLQQQKAQNAVAIRRLRQQLLKMHRLHNNILPLEKRIRAKPSEPIQLRTWHGISTE